MTVKDNIIDSVLQLTKELKTEELSFEIFAEIVASFDNDWAAELIEDLGKRGITIDERFAWGSSQYEDAYKEYQRYMSYEILPLRDLVRKEFGTSFGFATAFDVLDFKVAFQEAYEDNPDDYYKGYEEELAKVCDVTSALHFLRESSWDLWTAIREIASYVFPNIDMSILGDKTGLLCALLHKFGYVKDTEPFTNFDT